MRKGFLVISAIICLLIGGNSAAGDREKHDLPPRGRPDLGNYIGLSSGDLAGTADPETVTMNAQESVTAAFVPAPASFLKISGGGGHTLAIKADGTVWAWGYNISGQLGDGSNTDITTPVQVVHLTNAVSVAAGVYHGLALKDDGTVWAWGYNNYGQLGVDTGGSISATPVQVVGLTNAIAVAAGSDHCLAVKADGTVWAWGRNNWGQLGDGTRADSFTPLRVSALTNAVSVAASSNHSLAVKDDGTVWAWGFNAQGQLGDGTTTTQLTPVQVSGVTSAVAVAAGVVQPRWSHPIPAQAWNYKSLSRLPVRPSRYFPRPKPCRRP